MGGEEEKGERGKKSGFISGPHDRALETKTERAEFSDPHLLIGRRGRGGGRERLSSGF